MLTVGIVLATGVCVDDDDDAARLACCDCTAQDVWIPEIGERGWIILTSVHRELR